MPKIAMASTFIEAMSKLPKQQQRRVRDFLKKWQADPKAASINYEKIHNVRDERVRTVRIDQKYRAVMLHPDDGDTYVLVWVDNHDESMDWARNKEFGVNPATGAFQIINVDEVERVIEEVSKESEEEETDSSLFECSDSDLISFGVSDLLLPSVRALRKKNDIQKLTGVLPDEVVEALVWLAEDMPHEEIWEAIGGQTDDAPAPSLDESLDNPNSRRRVVTIKSIDEFEQILDAPLDKWRLYLHPSQQQLVEADFSGPVLVTGGAGTGKTVVAMHRAKHLLKNVFKSPADRILLTTFTANLADAIGELIKELCGQDAGRIDVLHLDAWAVRRLREEGISVVIASQDEVNQTWDVISMDDACEFDAVFLKDEYRYAVRAMGVSNKKDYLKLKRTGRPRSLDRLQKSRIWDLFDEFVQTLRNSGFWRWEDVLQRAAEVVDTPPYCSVITDESQDFTGPAWSLIRKLAPDSRNDLFMVGDERQRVYGSPVCLEACGINVENRSRDLRINYRTTEQIQSWAFGQLTEPDLVALSGKGGQASKSLLSGPVPEVVFFDNKDSELAMISELLPKLLEDIEPEEIAITARAKWILKDFVDVLNLLEVPFLQLDKAISSDREGVRLGTMHRIKGLEFRCVIAVSVNEGIIPVTYRGRDDDLKSIKNHRRRERALLYVATTRARERCYVSTSGKPSSLLVD